MYISRERLKELLTSKLMLGAIQEHFYSDISLYDTLALKLALYNADNKTEFKDFTEIAEYLIDNDKYHG